MIQTTSVDVTDEQREDAQPITVDGHSGDWSATAHELDPDLGHGSRVVGSRPPPPCPAPFGDNAGVGRDTGRLSVTIAAPVESIVAALLDFDSYPQWQRIMRDVRILERDGEGRPLLVEFTVDAKVRTVRYVSRYRYDLPHGLAWDLDHGDLRRNSGSYTFSTRADGGTDVRVEISFDPGFYVPGPVRQLVQDRSLRLTMRELRTRVGG